MTGFIQTEMLSTKYDLRYDTETRKYHILRFPDYKISQEFNRREDALNALNLNKIRWHKS